MSRSSAPLPEGVLDGFLSIRRVPGDPDGQTICTVAVRGDEALASGRLAPTQCFQQLSVTIDPHRTELIARSRGQRLAICKLVDFHVPCLQRGCASSRGSVWGGAHAHPIHGMRNLDAITPGAWSRVYWTMVSVDPIASAASGVTRPLFGASEKKIKRLAADAGTLVLQTDTKG